MARGFLILIICLLWLPITADARVPESERSRDAIQRVMPSLKRDLRASGFRLGSPLFIRVFKEEAELEIWLRKGQNFALFRTYPICTYSGGLGPKLREQDEQSPEGFYIVQARDMNPNSRFHLSFDLGYPNAFDKTHGRTGSLLMVHGDCKSRGCFAMARTPWPEAEDNEEAIEEIWTLMAAAFRKGQPFISVHALPFRLTEKNLHKHRRSKWTNFWRQLKDGYDLFEMMRIPPVIGVTNRQYVFE